MAKRRFTNDDRRSILRALFTEGGFLARIRFANIEVSKIQFAVDGTFDTRYN